LHLVCYVAVFSLCIYYSVSYLVSMSCCVILHDMSSNKIRPPYFFTKPQPEADNFLRAKAATAFSASYHRNSVRPSVCPSVPRVDQSKKVQTRITKFSTSAAWKTLVSRTVKLFYKFDHPE